MLLLVGQIVVFTEFANALAAVVAAGRKDVGFVAGVPHRVMPSLTHRDGRPLFRDDQSGQVNTETVEVMKIHAGTVDHNVHLRQRSSLLPAQSRQVHQHRVGIPCAAVDAPYDLNCPLPVIRRSLGQGLALARQENVNLFKKRSALIHVRISD